MITNSKLKLVFTLAISILSVNIVHAASARTEIQSLVKHYHLTNAEISISAQRTMTGKNLYAYSQNKPMTPASNNKVFTIVAALFALPKNLTFNTSVYYNSTKVKNHILNGNLYFKFTGDPALNGSQLSKLVNKIKTEKGITNINGTVYLVGTFSGPYIPQGWTKEDSTFCYGSPASSFTLNRNCSVIKLSKIPNSTNTKVIKISNATNIHIDDTAIYTSTSKPTYINMDRDNTLHISGYLSRTAEKMFQLSIKNPALKTLDTVNDFLSYDGIKHNKVMIGKSIPASNTSQIITRSTHIGSFMNRTLKHSDNLYAETILNTIGLNKKGIASTKTGTAAVQQILYEDLHLDTSGLTMFDGSGLSQLDTVTTKFMVNFLTKSFNSKIGKQFYKYLPSSGISGTIAYRMGGKMLGKVHAKTGTLSGVSTLSGYVLTSKNHRISFSIMLNNLKLKDRTNARRFQDKVVNVFYRYM